ncbi:hypothetical protein FGAF374_50640 (plasmid) [Escherichia coli]|nr:hypothetical protein FGAF374_50640 [Escherichia coli]
MWIGSKYLLNLWAIHSRSFLKTVYNFQCCKSIAVEREWKIAYPFRMDKFNSSNIYFIINIITHYLISINGGNKSRH